MAGTKSIRLNLFLFHLGKEVMDENTIAIRIKSAYFHFRLIHHFCKQLKSKEQVDVGAFILFPLFFNLSLNHVNYYKSSDIMYKQVRTVQLFVTQMSQRDYYQ